MVRSSCVKFIRVIDYFCVIPCILPFYTRILLANILVWAFSLLRAHILCASLRFGLVAEGKKIGQNKYLIDLFTKKNYNLFFLVCIYIYSNRVLYSWDLFIINTLICLRLTCLIFEHKLNFQVSSFAK